jgi:hypothetical protein
MMVVPLCKAADLWLSICPDGRHVNSIFFDGTKGQLGLVSAPHLNKVFSGIPSFEMLYLLYDGDVEEPNTSIPSKSRCVLNGCDKCV